MESMKKVLRKIRDSVDEQPSKKKKKKLKRAV